MKSYLFYSGCLSLAAIGSLQAADIVWRDTGNVFETGTNWVGNAAPGGNDRAVFNSFTFQPNLGAARAMQGLVFNTSGADFSGATLVLREAGVVSRGNGVNLIRNAISVNGGATGINFDVGAGNTLELQGVLTYSGKTWKKTGDGILKTTQINTGASGSSSRIEILGGTLHALQGGFSGGTETLVLNGGRLLAETVGGFNANSNMTFFLGNAGGVIENALGGFSNVLKIGGGISNLSGESGSVTFRGSNAATYIELSAKAGSYTGSTTVEGAVLRLNKAAFQGNLLGATTSLTLDGSSTLDMNGASASERLGSLAGSGVVQATTVNAHYIVGGNDTSTTFSGVIRDNNGKVAITKEGGGVWTLGGVNTYTGATSITEGELRLAAGAALGNTLVTLGTATLGGSGSVQGSVTTEGVGSRIAPIDALTLGALDARDGATFSFDLDSLGQLNVTGELLGSTDPDSMIFEFHGGEEGVVYTLLGFGAGSDLDLGAFQLANVAYVLDASYQSGGWYYDNGAGTLSVRFAAVPEPGAMALILLGVGGVWFVNRKGRTL